MGAIATTSTGSDMHLVACLGDLSSRNGSSGKGRPYSPVMGI